MFKYRFSVSTPAFFERTLGEGSVHAGRLTCESNFLGLWALRVQFNNLIPQSRDKHAQTIRAETTIGPCFLLVVNHA